MYVPLITLFMNLINQLTFDLSLSLQELTAQPVPASPLPAPGVSTVRMTRIRYQTDPAMLGSTVMVAHQYRILCLVAWVITALRGRKWRSPVHQEHSQVIETWWVQSIFHLIVELGSLRICKCKMFLKKPTDCTNVMCIIICRVAILKCDLLCSARYLSRYLLRYMQSNVAKYKENYPKISYISSNVCILSNFTNMVSIWSSVTCF